jgi:hypothetical protein
LKNRDAVRINSDTAFVNINAHRAKFSVLFVSEKLNLITVEAT